MGKSLQGKCRLCGEIRALTREHIPAEGAYKGRPYAVEVLTGDAVLEGGRGKPFQRGFHARVFCEECNRLTGSWYGGEFAKWSQWGFSLLEATRVRSTAPINPYEGYPLRIAKQVMSTMIASSQEGFTDHNPRFRAFVLDRGKTADAGEIRLSTYLCPTSTGRSTGVAVAMKPGAAHHVLVEFALPPFGYVLTLEGEPLDTRPADISWFTTCGYDDRQKVMLAELPVLPTHEAFPGDYRSKTEIRRDVIINILREQRHSAPDIEAARIIAADEGPAFFAANGETW
jgi:hypothetical protein